MRSTLALEVEGDSLVRTGADLAVAGVFRDQRPLRGGAGVADWRLCGWLSDLAASARLTGEAGRHALVLTRGRLGSPRLLLLGLGARARFGEEARRAALREGVERALELGAASIALDMPKPLEDDSLEGFAAALLESACAVLEAQPSRLLVRLVAPLGGAARLRGAVEQTAGGLPRGSVSIKMLKPAPVSAPAPPASPGVRPPRPPAPAPGR